MSCTLKFIYPGQAGLRFATCTHPGHTWAMLAPGTGTAKAKVEHGKHWCEIEREMPACDWCEGSGSAWAGAPAGEGPACSFCHGSGRSHPLNATHQENPA